MGSADRVELRPARDTLTQRLLRHFDWNKNQGLPHLLGRVLLGRAARRTKA
jgi:hypothetical protein